jgi:hypothetical protein
MRFDSIAVKESTIPGNNGETALCLFKGWSFCYGAAEVCALRRTASKWWRRTAAARSQAGASSSGLRAMNGSPISSALGFLGLSLGLAGYLGARIAAPVQALRTLAQSAGRGTRLQVMRYSARSKPILTGKVGHENTTWYRIPSGFWRDMARGARTLGPCQQKNRGTFAAQASCPGYRP